MSRAWRGDERAVSSPLGYVLNLGIVAVVLVGLGTAGTVFLDTNTDAAVEGALETQGNSLAGEIQAVDRAAAEAGPAESVDQRATLATSVRGTGYSVEVVNASVAGGAAAAVEHAGECERACLVLVTDEGDVRTTVRFVSATPVETTRFDGGPVRVHRPAGTDHLRFEPLDDAG